MFVRDRWTGQTARVSVDSDGGQADGHSDLPSLSADSRHVAFQSLATNLVPGDTNGTEDVFVHDRWTGETSLVSTHYGGGPSNGNSGEASISPDGRYVAFHSFASDLVLGDTNGTNDVFVHDLSTGETRLVSHNDRGGAANGQSLTPSMGADGFVAFSSSASDLLPGDTNGTEDVFVHDLLTAESRLVSLNSEGEQADWFSRVPAISADGRHVVFQSLAFNLVPDDTNLDQDIFVHDRRTGVTTRVSVGSEGAQANSYSYAPSLSADGRYVAYQSMATNLVPGDANSSPDIFVHDRWTGQTWRASVDARGVEGNETSWGASLSGDGRFVAFSSIASNLIARDSNGVADIFLVTLSPSYDRTLPAGWNLVAGASGSNCADATLFGFNGTSYYSLPATNLVAGRGYWVRLAVSTNVSLTSVPSPLQVHLMPGWNLIGNATPGPVTLPPGKTGFVFDGTRYLSSATLEAAQGAWVRAAVEEDIYLAHAP